MEAEIRCPYCDFDMLDALSIEINTSRFTNYYSSGDELRCHHCNKVFKVKVHEMYKITKLIEEE